MNCHTQLMAPFVICANFECITVPINEKHGNNTEAYQELFVKVDCYIPKCLF